MVIIIFVYCVHLPVCVEAKDNHIEASIQDCMEIKEEHIIPQRKVTPPLPAYMIDESPMPINDFILGKIMENLKEDVGCDTVTVSLNQVENAIYDSWFDDSLMFKNK